MVVRVKRTGKLIDTGSKCCVYGKSGIGKTKLLGTAPEPIVLSCEAGLKSLIEENVAYIEIRKVADIYDALNYCTRSVRGRKYATIGLDSISEIAEVVLADHKKGKKDPRNAYGELADEMAELIRDFRDIPNRNIVMTAKRGRLVDQDSGLTQYVASMPGKILPEGLPYFFDEVFYMDLYEKQNGREIRVLKTYTSFDHDAKDRSGKLKKMELPNLTNIFNKIKSPKVGRKK